jgi:hypothetical protein
MHFGVDGSSPAIENDGDESNEGSNPKNDSDEAINLEDVVLITRNPESDLKMARTVGEISQHQSVSSKHPPRHIWS